MMLLTQEIKKAIPALYAQDGKGKDAIVYVKFFNPIGSWTWYATEYDPDTRTFFGCVVGDFTELGYFSLDELESLELPGGLGIERDLHFTRQTLREAIKTGA